LRLHDRFEWNAAKAKANLRKHAMSFDDAAIVLADEEGERFHVEEYDDAQQHGRRPLDHDCLSSIRSADRAPNRLDPALERRDDADPDHRRAPCDASGEDEI